MITKQAGRGRQAAILRGCTGPKISIAAHHLSLYHRVLMIDSNLCPPEPETIAEAYAMGTLSTEQRTAFEDHYICCERCATLLQETAAYVEAMRTAAKDLRSKPSKSTTARR